jgi:hypothetical protein
VTLTFVSELHAIEGLRTASAVAGKSSSLEGGNFDGGHASCFSAVTLHAHGVEVALRGVPRR